MRLVALFIGLLSWTAAHAENVELELVLAVDTSTSVDDREYDLQRNGLAYALRSQPVQAAIRSLGGDGLAIAVVQWAGPGQQVLASDWHHLSTDSDAERLATTIERMPRLVSGFTDIAGAIDFSRRAILDNRFTGARLAIDVSGDGTSDRNDPGPARDRALSEGITINGLVIHSEEYDLGDLAGFSLVHHYKTRVIGGPGHFLIEAADFDDFADAMRRKLTREISGATFAKRDCQSVRESCKTKRN